MLIRAGEQLNLSREKLDKTEKWVKEKLQEIKKSKKVYVFKSTMKPVKLEDDQGYLHTDHRNVSIPTEVLFDNPDTGLTENWQLITNSGSFKRRANGDIDVKREPGLRVSTEGRFLHADRDAETIFYLGFIAMGMYKKYMYLEDKAAEAEALNKELMMQDMALNIISDPTSIISKEVTGSSEVMQQLAVAWGVVGAEGLTYSELKLNLRRAVIGSHNDRVKTRRGFEEFITDANRLGDSEKRSTILLGIERDILVFEANTWSIKLRGGGLQSLRSIPPGEETNKDNWIIRFLTNSENNQFYELLDSLIKNPIKEKVVTLGKNKTELLKICKEDLGWPHQKVWSKKKEDLEKIVIEQLRYSE